MFGNIFLISDSNTNEKYIKAIEREVEDQKLSVDYYLSESKKKEIVDALVQGKTVIEKKSSETYDQYNFSRYVLNILLKDIISGQRGKFHKLFDKYLTVEMLDEIKNRFKNNPCVQDDITTTPDQIQTVDNEIKISQISYPEKISYTNVLSFLMKLHKLFNWDKYESKRDIGKESCLKSEIVELKKALDIVNDEESNIREFLKVVNSYTEIEELTPEILNNFIDRIYIGEKYSDGSAHKQEIRIIYKFIGAESTHGYKVKGSRVAEIF